MGSSQPFLKDPNILLYLQTDKSFYFSGQQITGSINLQFKADIFFNKIFLAFEGYEQTNWTEGTGSDQYTYQNKCQTFKESFLIHQSPIGYKQGCYLFPFKLRLPQNVAGSFKSQDGKNQIKYYLSVKLIDYSQRNNNNIYNKNLTIVQPIRINKDVIQIKQKIYLLGCCNDYGEVTFKIQFHSNIVGMGEVVKVRIDVDKRQTDQNLNRIKIKFTNNLFLKSNSKDSILQTEIKEQIIHLTNNQQQRIEVQFVIPQISKHISTGSIISNYYTLGVVPMLREGLSMNDGWLLKQTIMITEIPVRIQEENIVVPLDWNPIVFQTLSFKAKEFVYKKNKMIKNIMNRIEYPK